jgi:RsiW-degrading membrane proteinase PrsW (M82 family)
MLLSPEILSESKSARNSLINNNERAFESLNKAKALVMGVWQGTGFATTEQVAQYFDTLRAEATEILRTE